jgi:hypothetical protein
MNLDLIQSTTPTPRRNLAVSPYHITCPAVTARPLLRVFHLTLPNRNMHRPVYLRRGTAYMSQRLPSHPSARLTQFPSGPRPAPYIHEKAQRRLTLCIDQRRAFTLLVQILKLAPRQTSGRASLNSHPASRSRLLCFLRYFSGTPSVQHRALLIFISILRMPTRQKTMSPPKADST